MLEFSWFITVISLVLHWWFQMVFQCWKRVISSNIGKFELQYPTLEDKFPTLDHLIFQQW